MYANFQGQYNLCNQTSTSNDFDARHPYDSLLGPAMFY